MNIPRWLLVSLGLLASAHALERYVSPQGDDRNPGTLAAPWRTPEGARDAVRAWRQAQPAGAREPMTVWLRGGTYPLSRTFELTQQDGGTAEARVTYAAYQHETVRLSGGREIPAKAFGPAMALSRSTLYFTKPSIFGSYLESIRIRSVVFN